MTTPGIPLRIDSITLKNPQGREIPNGSWLQRNNPLHDIRIPHQVAATNTLETYVSSFVKALSPVSFAKRSSPFGMGYLSSFEAWFTVSLKSPQIQRDFPLLFTTGTIGAAQAANWALPIERCSSYHMSTGAYMVGLQVPLHKVHDE